LKPTGNPGRADFMASLDLACGQRTIANLHRVAKKEIVEFGRTELSCTF